ncbi:MAG: acylneuraminate cytidylyltransferase family protein [Pseudomonadota bacterium]
MIAGKSVLAIIPARGGSKGVPRKNIREVAGSPLIAWTIEEAKKSKYIDRLILSSDDEEIIEIAKSLGCEVPFVRPSELAQDETPGIAPVLHAIDNLLGYEIVVLLQATSPLRSVADIDGCLEFCIAKDVNACVSVTHAEESPYWMYTVGAEGSLHPLLATDQQITRRQDLPQAYVLNGAVYVAHCDWLRKNKSFMAEETAGFVMPQERSLDIDTEMDLEYFKLLKEAAHEKT